jgi:8-oxo-dGTP pyrophosphatase MutT (NUDIX family)|tara:strand:+ start:567 stop:1034 length:468 start_codon:yes stop_codon:yes gene_type:complete
MRCLVKEIFYRAGGGVVLDDRGRVLLIERHVERGGEQVHEVRLPKGHVEAGETDEQAAIREVREETGYGDLRIIADLESYRHSFEHGGARITREERYFLMVLVSDVNYGQDMSAGSEEALFEPTWEDSLYEAELKLSFESEREFVRRAAAHRLLP